MKKIIILAIATLSTGIVLSSSLKSNKAAVKSIVVSQQKETANENKNSAAPLKDVLSQAD